MDPEKLREEFTRMLTVDSETTDRRRRDHNQAIFEPYDPVSRRGGYSIWSHTDLSMVLDKFDKAVRNVQAG